MKRKLKRFRLWVGVSLLAGLVWTGAALGSTFMSGSVLASPGNDSFANATVLSGQNVSRLGDTNVDATLEAGEDPNIAERPASHTVWYSWTAAQRGQVTIDTTTSGFDTLLGVYTGTAVSSLTEIASNDDNGPDTTSAVTFNVTAGTTYRVRVGGFDPTVDIGVVNLHVNEILHPANDDFANATLLSGISVMRNSDTNVAATLETGEAAKVAGISASTSVWYSWTAPVNGTVRIDTGGSDFDTLLGVYTGNAVDALIEVASDDDDPPSQTSSVTFDVVNGSTYRIRTDGFGGAAGAINLHLVYTLIIPRVPDAPTGVSATAAPGQASVTWSAPAVDGFSPISGYKVTRYVGGAEQGTTTVGVVTQTTVGGLTNGTTYTFRVAAVNGAGTGMESAGSNAVTPRTVPDAPTSVTATAGTGLATVNWAAPASNGGDAIVGYDVTSYLGGVAQGTTTVGAGTQATLTGLTNGTTYTFRVAARNGVGTGARSADSNAVTPIAPAAPRFTLAVSKSGTGAGSVTSSAGGINCGATCAADFDAGTNVTLSATPASGSVFAGWSGACTGTGSCAVTVDAAKAVTAAFAPLAQTQAAVVAKCTVPRVTGKLLAAAKKKIVAAHCRTGTVTRAKSRTVGKGRVISQRPKAGRKLARGSKVSLVVSLGSG